MDLFHSPAGFVQLSLSYGGATPEVMAIPAPPPTEATDADVPNSEVSELLASEFDKIEFPNPNIVSENHMIVSEYYGIQSSESLVSSDTENHLGPKIDSHAVEDLSKGIVNLVQISRPEGNAELQREIKRFFAIILCSIFGNCLVLNEGIFCPVSPFLFPPLFLYLFKIDDDGDGDGGRGGEAGEVLEMVPEIC
ncbi:hypothetical protein LguiB_009830 [Lonicera macranthoides]